MNRKSLPTVIVLFITLFLFDGSGAKAEMYSSEGIGTQIILQIGNPTMLVNGTKKMIDPGMGTTASTYNGITFVPLKSIIEELGGTLTFSPQDQNIVFQLGNQKIQLQLNSDAEIIDGESKKIGVKPKIVKGRTLVPLRVITDLNVRMYWDNESKRISLYYGGNGERWYEDNYTQKESDTYGKYFDQSIGYSVDYLLEWGKPVVIQSKESLETIFYESNAVKVSSYSDHMLTSYNDNDGLRLEESYEEYLERNGFMEGNPEVNQLPEKNADRTYSIFRDEGNKVFAYLVFFKEDQVGVFQFMMRNDSRQMTSKDVRAVEAFTDLFVESFQLDSSVG